MVTCNVGRVRHRIDACVRTRELRVCSGRHRGILVIHLSGTRVVWFNTADFVRRGLGKGRLFVKAWRSEGFDLEQLFVSSVDVAT